jgi:hypothetical protein
MTPSAFITKWKASNLKERSAAHEHFIDICRLLGEQTPAAADPDGEWYCFEQDATKLTGGDGWADVWKRGYFGWEYKGKHKDLKAAYVQLQQYSVALENPPLMVVCDMDQFRIHTNWTNTIQKTYDITLDDLHEPDQRQILKWVFSDPERLKPGKTRQTLTEEAAKQFASLAYRLRARGHDPQDEALPFDHQDTALVLKAATLDWSDIDPSIFGTLFERGLDPDKRSQLGAHYTDRDKIMMLVEPVVIRPLQAEWETIKAQIAQHMERAEKAKAASTRTRAWNAAQALHNRFLDRLKQVRVLDPACGSGNFLYLALLALKDLEHKANLDAEALGLERQFPSIGPECIKGLEINAYAAELARVTVWIGEIQWMRRNGFELERKPILRPLDTIECRDAVMNPDGSEAQKIAAAAKRLNELRNNWLNPSDLVMPVPEVVAGYPDRIVPKDAAAAQVLKQRTLTNLYNERPAWLDNAHRDQDKAVADVYGWKPDMSDNEMLTKLLALNLERAKEHPRQ